MPLFTDAINALRTAGFPESSLPGILANIDVETGGTYDYQQKQHKGGPGYGLFQFDSQKDEYFDWLEDEDKKDSALSQSQFVYELIYDKDPAYDIGYGHRKKLRKSFLEDTPRDVAYEFMRRYERPSIPHLDKRLESALKWKGMLTGN